MVNKKPESSYSPGKKKNIVFHKNKCYFKNIYIYIFHKTSMALKATTNSYGQLAG